MFDTSSLASDSLARLPAGFAPRAWRALGAQWRAQRSPQGVVLALSLWLTLAGNLALWRRLGQVPELTASHGLVYLQLGALVFLATLAWLTLFAWPRGMKPVWAGMLVLAAVAQHFMLAYGVFIDRSMVLNVTHTNVSEARDLLGLPLLASLVLVAGPPLAWLLPLRVSSRGRWRELGRTGLLLALSLGTLAGAALASYRELAPLVRNHMELRFMVNPLSSVVSTASAVLKPMLQRQRPFVPISAGAALGASYGRQTKPPLLVLVLGETARADHFALNGYARDTTPELAAREVLSWRQVRSCGTNTLASVPCMFSHLGKQGYESRRADHENLLDVLQAAGLAVLWLDNQAGCKSVCDRVAQASTSDALGTLAGRTLCQGDECLDELMLVGLDERIDRLPEAQRRRGVVLVMHQMGSHGPAYYRRSSPETKRFLPECMTHALADCPQQALVNAYDNTIAYTDRFLARTIDWLERHDADRDVGMLYVSDHGESLGEYGLFLHGVPYAVAPEVQKHVSMVLWPGSLLARGSTDLRCLRRGLDAPLSHDNYYHTVLGLLDVATPTYRRGLDAFAACRTEPGALD